MRDVSATSRLLIVTGGVVALAGLVPVAAASAATPPPKPSPSCKVPVLSVTPLKAKPGSKVSVSGRNFSGCSAQGSSAKPTSVLTVKVGVETASKKGAVLATTKTTAAGSFSVSVTVPALSSAGVPKIGLAAAAKDPATGLTYAGVAVLAYDTSASPTPIASSGSAVASVSPITASASASAVGGGVPTAVPAGSGGQAATTNSVTRDEQFGLLAVGAVLVGAGGLGLTRRRRHRVH